MTKEAAERLIKSLCERITIHGPAGQALERILDVLLWARWAPFSDEKIIGYFDLASMINDSYQWDLICADVGQRASLARSESSQLREITIRDLEEARAALLPLSRMIQSGDIQQCKTVVEALVAVNADFSGRLGGVFLSTPSMASLWGALLATHKSNEAVACLFPSAMGAAPILGADHALIISNEMLKQQSWPLALLSLYPGERKLHAIEAHPHWSLAIAGPAWSEKTRGPLEYDPWLPGAILDCPEAIKDSEARKIYAAHQRCTGTTLALSSPGLAFRASRDLEYFREALVRNNWLDAVVSLPNGAISGTRLDGLLLVLKHGRQTGESIQLIQAQEILARPKRATGWGEWDPDGVSLVASLISARGESSASTLVSPDALASNGFNLQPSRYLHKEKDITLQRYLESRETMQLSDLAEIRRPVASLGRQEEDGFEMREVTSGDLDESGRLVKASKVIRMPEVVLSKGRQHLLERGDVLLSIKGGLGKVAEVQDLEHPTLPGQAFCVIRLRPNAPLSSKALVQYLRSSVGQSLLSKAGKGTTVAFVPMGDVKSLPIVIPTAAELKRAEELQEESMELSHELENLSRRLAELSQVGWMQDLPPALTASSEENRL